MLTALSTADARYAPARLGLFSASHTHLEAREGGRGRGSTSRVEVKSQERRLSRIRMVIVPGRVLSCLAMQQVLLRSACTVQYMYAVDQLYVSPVGRRQLRVPCMVTQRGPKRGPRRPLSQRGLIIGSVVNRREARPGASHPWCATR